MFDPSKMRFVVATNRGLAKNDTAQLDEKLAALIAESMCAMRNDRGACTRRDLLDCGFTNDELTRLGDRATEIAAIDWHGRNMVEAAA